MNGVATDAQALTTLVERAGAGDEIAFARLVATYQIDLIRVAYVVSGDRALAEEAAESAWWIAWRKLPGLRDPLRVRPWLVAVAANEARKLVGKQHRRSLVELRLDQYARADARPDPPGASAGAATRLPDPATYGPDRQIDCLDLANALARLGAEDRALIALRYAADLDSDEIGRLLGLSASGVRTRLARLLGRLRKDLDHA